MIYQNNEPEIIRVAHLMDGRVKFFRTPVAFGHGMYIKPDVRSKAIHDGRLMKNSGPNMGVWRVELVPAELGIQYFLDHEEPEVEIEPSVPVGVCCIGGCQVRPRNKKSSYCDNHYAQELGVELDPSTQDQFHETIAIYPVARRT